MTDEHIKKYLFSIGAQSLWDDLQQDDNLLGFARNPLFLSLSVLASDYINLGEWQQKKTMHERQAYLVDAYIDQCINKNLSAKEQSPKDSLSTREKNWLIWLAQKLTEDSEEDFLIERMQPNKLLRSQNLRNQYTRIVSGTILAILFLCFGIVFALLYGKYFGLTSSLGVIVFEAFIFLFPMQFDFSIEPIEIVDNLNFQFSLPSIKRLIKNFPLGIKIGIFLTVPLSSALGSFIHLKNAFEGVEPTFSAAIRPLFSGLSLGLFLGLVITLYLSSRREVLSCFRPNQGIFSSVRRAIVFSFLTYPIGVLVALNSHLITTNYLGLHEALISGIAFALTVGVASGGGYTVVQHVSLRIVLYSSGNIPWNYARFLNQCTDRLLLQRVGGRYRFIHKLVQEHFAAMPLK